MLRQIFACNQKIGLERLRKYDFIVEKLIHGIDFCEEKENCLFFVSTVNRTRSNEAKLDQRRFRIDIRENSLTVMIINH